MGLFEKLFRKESEENKFNVKFTTDPKNVQAIYNTATLLHQMKKYDEAEKVYREAISIDPNFAEAHNNLGKLLIDLNRTDEGNREAEIALKLFKQQGNRKMAEMLENVLRTI